MILQGNKRPLAGAAWTLEGRAVVVAHRGDHQLAALHFTRPAPGLDAQLFPLPLPKLSTGAGACSTIPAPLLAYNPLFQRCT